MSPHRLELDYIAAPRRSSLLGMMVLAAALALAAILCIRYYHLLQERSALSSRLELLDAGPRISRSVNAGGAEQVAKEIDSILRQLALPWAQIIASVESTASGEVLLLQLQPEPEHHILRLTAEAGTPEAMLEYMRRLGDSKLLSGAHLVSHRIQRENPSHPVQFVAQASLKDSR